MTATRLLPSWIFFVCNKCERADDDAFADADADTNADAMLTDYNIGDAGVGLIASAVERNTMLTELNLIGV